MAPAGLDLECYAEEVEAEIRRRQIAVAER
jgi:hypothetical protein